MHDVRKYYRRLNHRGYGLTELAAIGDRIVTGFFDDEAAFAAACRLYNGYNVYAGRNPRPPGISWIKNHMGCSKRARDFDIRFLTAISLDIDPVRESLAATEEQHEQAVSFALKLQGSIGGDVDDSGNGAYLWIPFRTPVEVGSDFFILKRQCAAWQRVVKERFRPEKYRLRIDGCFDFSRLKRVIGSFNHKAQRFSRMVKWSEPDDKVREEILSMDVRVPAGPVFVNFQRELPLRFRRLLRWDFSVRRLWQNPDPLNDTSRHDWRLG
ncbi:MAG: hypothetical protein ABH879_00360, partial [archaeon]